MRAVFIFIFLLCVPVAFAVSQNAASLTIDGFLSIPIEVKPVGSNPSISSLTTTMSWYPIAHQGQEILFFTTTPTAKTVDDALIFSLTKPALGHHSFDIEYQVKTFADPLLIKKQVVFPLTSLDSSLSEYLDATETIDITPQIRSLAADLASDEDDLFFLVTKVAAWTKANIAYDLSTLNVEASQPSSWVLENKEGVCDEMTNLFISLLRSLGIPARFVSGLAYTESDLFDKPWGAHGWAEVYFPGVGWVPFDVTYGQLGWVDASHIVFAAGIDSEKFGNSFTWLGHDIDVVINQMTIDASIVEESGSLPSALTLDITPLQDEIGHNSYQLVIVDVENTKPYYVADELQLAQVNGLSFLDDLFQVIMLAPYEKKQFYWRVLVDDELEDNYVYNFPLIVVSQRDVSARNAFSVLSSSRSLSLSWIERFMHSLNETALPYNDEVLFDCVASVVSPRVLEKTTFICTINNTGELDVSKARVCLFDECKEISIESFTSTTQEFIWSSADASLFSLPFSLQDELLDKYSFVIVDVTIPPKISILNISAPTSLDFTATDVVSFTVLHEGAVAKDAIISLKGPHLTNEWSFSVLEGRKVFEITIAGDALSLDPVPFSIVVSYVDDKNNPVTIEDSFSIVLGEVTWYQKLYLRILRLF